MHVPHLSAADYCRAWGIDPCEGFVHQSTRRRQLPPPRPATMKKKTTYCGDCGQPSDRGCIPRCRRCSGGDWVKPTVREKAEARAEQRAEQATAILRTFAPRAAIERRRGGIYVTWKHYRTGEVTARRWSTRGHSHYPPWSDIWPHGGTSLTALHMLVRWVRGLSVYGFATWRYWASAAVGLANARTFAALEAAGWPLTATCVLCGGDHPGDWTNRNGGGPCCSLAKCQHPAPAA